MNKNKPTLSLSPMNSEGSIRLSWEKLDGYERYNVYFRRENDEYKRITSTERTSVVVSGVDTTLLCYFKVCAVSYNGEEALERETDTSRLIKPVKFLTLGSSNLEKVFENKVKIKADNTIRTISPLTLFFPNKVEGVYYGNVDFEKTAKHYITTRCADYLLLDFYGAAITPVAKIENSFITLNEAFLKSDHYKQTEERLEELPLILPFEVIQPLMDIFISEILKVFPKNKIVLSRFSTPKYNAVSNQIRACSDRKKLNSYIARLEKYFIEKTDPIVVDISKSFFGDLELTRGGEVIFESYYYRRFSNILEQIAEGSTGRFTGIDTDIRLERILYYYENLTTRGFTGAMLDRKHPADLIMIQTSREFIAENYAEIKKMLNGSYKGVSDLYRRYNFGGNTEMKNTVKVLAAIENNNLSRIRFCDAETQLRKNYRMKRSLSQFAKATLDSALGRRVIITEKNLVFMLKAAFELWDGADPEAMSQRIDEYLKICSQTPVDIWGSCVSREPLNRCHEVTVDKYLFKNTVVWAFDPVLSCDPKLFQKDENFGSAWRRRTIEETANRKATEIISSSTSPWIIVDFYDVSSQMARYKGGCFEVDSFIKRTPFFDMLDEKPELFYLDPQKDKELVLVAVDKMSELLKNKYGKKIILNKVSLNTEYRDLSGNTKPLDMNIEQLRKSQRLITMCEERFIANTGCYVISMTDRYISDDRFPLGGAHPAHYEDMYYSGNAAYIDYIVKNEPEARYFNKL